MRLSTKARYAVMAMVDMAQNEKGMPTSLSAISQRQNLPLPYLEQLFNKLRKSGLVTSVRGSGGGYSLSRPSKDIRVYDIVAAVDRPLKATRCETDSPKGCSPSGGRCSTHDLWDELEAMIQVFLNRVSLADVCERRVLGMGRFFVAPETLPSKAEGPGKVWGVA